MHAATNTHVARFYFPPSKRKNRTDWEPNLDYFARQFDGHPERSKNLHFAFVVLLRAVRRASPTPRPHLGHISATSRPHLGHISATPRPHLDHTSPTSRPHLAQVRRASPFLSAYDYSLARHAVPSANDAAPGDTMDASALVQVRCPQMPSDSLSQPSTALRSPPHQLPPDLPPDLPPTAALSRHGDPQELLRRLRGFRRGASLPRRKVRLVVAQEAGELAISPCSPRDLPLSSR